MAANVQQTSSKRPANAFKIHVLMLDVCWKFAGRLLDRVNTPLWSFHTYDADATQPNSTALANNAWSVHSSVTSQCK